MLGRVITASIYGITASIIDVEADVASGLPLFNLIGNLSASTREGRDRVRNAIRNSGYKMAPSKIIVNMSPADIHKDGTHYDLAVAIAVLRGMHAISEDDGHTMYIGELGLDGKVHPVSGVLPMVMAGAEHGVCRCYVASDNYNEAASVHGIEVIGVKNLRECVDYVEGMRQFDKGEAHITMPSDIGVELDFADIRGQNALKRAIMIAGASFHNMLIFGPPGTGKSMAAMRIPGILPELTYSESLEISKLYSICGLLSNDNSLIMQRPFRSPHYTITRSAFCGGGRNPLPGEVSLAQAGVLFLDELNLFSADVIDTLREPLESGNIKIDRLYGSCVFSAQMMLVAAMNPCRCGYYPNRDKCTCTDSEVRQYIGKISKPIMDRIDIFVNASKVSYDEISGSEDEIYNSARMRTAIQSAIDIQKDRYKGEDFELNSRIPSDLLCKYCEMEAEASDIMRKAYEMYDISARSYNKILKVARTIADIEGHDIIRVPDICEAIGYKAVT